MPQPAALDELERPLVEAYRRAWDRVMAEQNSLIGDPKSAAKRSRLLRIASRIYTIMDEIDDGVEFWVGSQYPQAYALGVTQGGGLAEMIWTNIHQEAVEELAQSLFQDLLEATRGVRESTKSLVRSIARDEALQSTITGGTAQQAGRAMRDKLAEEGIHAVTYKDGSRHSLTEYSEMSMRTKTAEAYNSGTINAHGDVEFFEIFDGPNCGLDSHAGVQALGMIVDKATAQKYLISHPNCRRAFGPRPDVTSKKQARELAKNPDTVGAGQTTPGQQAAQTLQDQARAKVQTRKANRAARLERRRASRPALQQPDGPILQASTPSVPRRQVRLLDRNEFSEFLMTRPDDFRFEPDAAKRAGNLWSTEYDSMQAIRKVRKNVKGGLAPDFELGLDPGWMKRYATRIKDNEWEIVDALTEAEVNDYIVDAARALDELPVTEHTSTMYRGMRVDDLDSIKAGTVVDGQEFISFTDKRSIAELYLEESSYRPGKYSVMVELDPPSDMRDLKSIVPDRYTPVNESLFSGSLEIYDVDIDGDKVRVRARPLGAAPAPGPRPTPGIGGSTPTVRPSPKLTGRSAAEIDNELADLAAKLKAAPGGGARARIKRKIADLEAEKAVIPTVDPAVVAGLEKRLDDINVELDAARDKLRTASGGRARAKAKELIADAEARRNATLAELETLKGGFPLPPPPTPPPVVKPVVKPGPKPEPKPLVDLDGIPDLDTIRKDHWGWTNATAKKEQLRLKLERVPDVDELMRRRPGWTREVATRERQKLVNNLLGEYPGVKPPTGVKFVDPDPPVKPPVVPKPTPAPAPKPTPAPKGGSDVSKEVALLEGEIREIEPTLETMTKRVTSLIKVKGEANTRAKFLRAGPDKTRLEAIVKRLDDQLVLAKRQLADLRGEKRDIERRIKALKDQAGSTPTTAGTAFINPRTAGQSIQSVRDELEPELLKILGVGGGSTKLDTRMHRALVLSAQADPAFRARHADLWEYSTGPGGNQIVARVNFDIQREFDTGRLRKVLEDARDNVDIDRKHHDLLKESIGKLGAGGNKATDGDIKQYLRGLTKSMSSSTQTKIFGPKGLVHKRGEDAQSFLATVIDDSVASRWKGAPMKVEVNRTGRAFYQNTTRSVSLDVNGPARTAVHEASHGLEYNIPGWQRAAQHFREYRAKGQKPTSIYASKSGSQKEWGFSDEFQNHYMGRTYGVSSQADGTFIETYEGLHGSATEILAMGYEELFAAPKKLLAEDPEYFWFLVGLATGKISG